MKFRKNDEDLTLDDLEESGFYSQELIRNMRLREFNKLLLLPLELRMDREFMEPLFFAVKNSLGTYAIYRYSETLQKDPKRTLEVISKEPEVIFNTPLSRNEQFILSNVDISPAIIHYMDPSLKNDPVVIAALCQTSNPKVAREIINSDINVTSVLHTDSQSKTSTNLEPEGKGIDFLANASSEIRNNYEFLKEQSAKDKKIIDYAVHNIDKFGLEGIKAIRESSKDNTLSDCTTLIDEMTQKSEDDRYARVKKSLEEKGKDNPYATRWAVAMAAQRDDIKPETLQEVLNYSVLTMEKIKHEVNEQGEFVASLENMQQLVPPNLLNRMKDKVLQQELSIDGETLKQLEEYTAFYEKFNEKFKEEKRKKREISLQEVQDATSCERLSQVNEANIALTKDVVSRNTQQELTPKEEIKETDHSEVGE